MKRAGLAAIQAGRATLEAVLEIGVVTMITRGGPVAPLVVLRIVEELSVGSLSDWATTGILGKRRVRTASDALLVGMKRVGLPLAVGGGPALMVGYLASHGGSVAAVLVAAASAMVGAVTALWIHLANGAGYLGAGVGARKLPALMGLVAVMALFWAASAVASALVPHDDVARLVAVNVMSMFTRPWMLSVWIRSAAPEPPRSPAPAPPS